MSPPLADVETDNDTGRPVKNRKPPSARRIAANRKNARSSRGPVTKEGKERSRLNACKHNHRAELPILPGEDGAELDHRLEVWPQVLEAETEVEHFVAVQAVHLGWRIERSRRSDDAAAERRMTAVKKTEKDRRAEEARLLGLELDSDDDPEGVIRKLHRTPEGCRLLLNEWRSLQTSCDQYGFLFWGRRERLFHLLGKRLRDLFTDDELITGWIVALMGAVFGDEAPADKVQAIGEVFEGLRPPWMMVEEFQLRMEFLAAALAGKEESTERVRTYVDAAIFDLNKRLRRAQARARRALKLDLKSAWVDDTPAGARRFNYSQGHYRSFQAALRRLKDLQKNRPDGEGGGAPEAAPEVETTTGEGGIEESGPGRWGRQRRRCGRARRRRFGAHDDDGSRWGGGRGSAGIRHERTHCGRGERRAWSRGLGSGAWCNHRPQFEFGARRGEGSGSGGGRRPAGMRHERTHCGVPDERTFPAPSRTARSRPGSAGGTGWRER